MGVAHETVSMHDTDPSNSPVAHLSPSDEDDHEVFTGTEERWTPRPADASAVPYDRIAPPAETSREEFNYVQRRAVILARIERVGHPRALNQTYRELAAEFGASRSAIHRDMQALSGFVAANLDRDHVSIMDAVFRGAVLDLVEEGEWVEATEVGKEWYSWLSQLGEIERVADKLDLDATVRHPGDSEAYRVIEDDEFEADDRGRTE